MAETAPQLGVPRPTTDPTLLGQLRAVLARAGYTETDIAATLGSGGLPSMQSADVPSYRRRLPPRQQLTTLVELFMLGVSVPAEAAAAALAPIDPASLIDTGLIESRDGALISPIRLSPHRGLLVAHDRDDPAELRPDYVTDINPASRTLASLTVRRPVEAALDLGTGCGIQALLAARHARRVLAVDVNPRALAFTAFNAMLNGLSNVECRQGSLFEPVAGERFDLIVSNPPYVVSPDAEFVFRDSGRPGDTLCRDVVETAPDFLTDGGFAHVLCNWVHGAGEPWWDPLVRWIEGRGCDAWLLHYRSDDPLSYAESWNAPRRAANPTAYEETLDRWLAYYRCSGVEAIGYGAVVLRRRVGPTWIRRAEMPLGPTGDAGEQIERVFRAHDALAVAEDEQTLLAETFALVEPHRLSQEMVYRGGLYSPAPARLTLEQGVGTEASVPPEALHVLFGLDGARPLGAVVAEASESLELDLAELTAVAIAVVRQLLETGLVVLVPREPSP